MKHIRSLYRSPLKSGLTLLLLAAAAFLFLYNLSEYSVADREYREARDRYEGVLTVEEAPVPENRSVFEYFLLSDETNPGDTYGMASYEDYHQKSLDSDIIGKLSALPYVSRVEKRYLTAGVSPEYVRLDTDEHMYPFYARAVVVGTVKYRYYSSLHQSDSVKRSSPEIEALELVTLEDVELLAGDPAWLMDQEEQTVSLQTFKEEYRGQFTTADYAVDYQSRNSAYTLENHLYPGDAEALQPGRRVLVVARNNCVARMTLPLPEDRGIYPEGYLHRFDVGDDSLLDWWPYFTDITDLPDNWLDLEEYADLRELIRVTDDDVHTFDVVYGDDMAAQRRVAEGRIVCEEGRFLTPADAGQPVCVVNVDVLDAYGLKVGDTLTLNLGNYLSEQYAPLGAVAVNRGRQSTEYTTQTFTVIGSWRDLNEGNHPFRDLFWCWSNNAIFVPSAFLPECRNAEGHEFKPSEVSFVVGNAEDIPAFVEDCLPRVEELGLTYVFSDGGWLLVAKDLKQARSLARVKLLLFTGAAVFALILTVWLFIGRKKREYGILRALGMPEREAGARLLLPFLILGLTSTVVGFLAAQVATALKLAGEANRAPAPQILGALGFLLLLALLAFAGLLVIRRESILALIQEKQK